MMIDLLKFCDVVEGLVNGEVFSAVDCALDRGLEEVDTWLVDVEGDMLQIS